MKNLKGTLTLVFVLCCLPLCRPVLADEVNVKYLHKTDWLQLESENFVVVSDAKVEDATAMVKELEHFRYFMAFLLGYTQKELDGKTPVVLARSKKTLQALGLPTKRVAGMFVRTQWRGPVIFANAKGFSSADSGKANFGRTVILHELCHLLINNSSLGLATPPWYSEGIAEYFGTYLEKDGNVVIGNVGAVKNRFYAMVSRRSGVDSVDSENLFKTKQISSSDREGQRFYARSLAVVHYLNADPERRKKMFIFLRLLNMEWPVDDAFKKAFATEYKDFDQEVDNYLLSDYVYARVFPMGEGGVEFPSAKIAAITPDQRVALGFLVDKVSYLPEDVLGEGNREQMHKDVEKIYPDFFKVNEDTSEENEEPGKTD